MGYLHEGHLSLVRRSQKENDRTVVSIFVNPLQFGPGEDLKKYPRDFKRDAALLRREGVDFLFAPEAAELYPEGFQTSVKVEKLSLPLCGTTRPIHFGGVATVVLKLLNLVAPDTVYLGQKDYQQFKVVERMVFDLALPVRVAMAPIVREKDGLAMSSRNVYLSLEDRKRAPAIYQALLDCRRKAKDGFRKVGGLRQGLRRALEAIPGARVDYAEIVHAGTLEPMVELKNGRTAVAAVAVYFGKTRLIDNILIKG